MLVLAIRNLWDHKLRTLLLGAAVVAGVSFVVASFVFTDSLSAGFSSIFSGATEGIDIVVSPPGGDGDDEPFSLPTLDLAMAPEIEAVAGVAEVRPNVQGFVSIVAEDGSTGQGFGPPTFGISWPTEAGFLELSQGVEPTGPDDVVIDVGSATGLDIEVGDSIDLAGAGPVQTYNVVGLFTVGGSERSVGPKFLAFTYETVTALLGMEDQVTGFDISVESGVDLAATVGTIGATLGDRAEVVDARAQAEEQTADLQQGLGFFNTFLLVFAAISLIVGAFVVYNAFRVVVSQRSKELALLRLLGTTRRQLVASVMTEAGFVGVLASVLGVIVGVGLAIAVRAILAQTGSSFPDDGLVVAPRTVLVGVIVGVATTLLSALIPSLRTASITPMEALRDQPNLRSRRPVWDWIGLVLLIASVAACLVAVDRASDGAAISGATQPIQIAGAGALGCFIAVVLLSRSLVAPVIGLLGKVGSTTSAVLAKENARQSPRRTATTATALTIGLGLVASVAVMAESVESTIISSIDDAFAADLVVQSSGFGGFGGMPPEVAGVVARVDGVQEVSPVNAVTLDIGDSESVLVAGVQPETVETALVFEHVEGSFAELVGNTVAVQQIEADRLGLALGDTVTMTRNSESFDTTIVAIYDFAGDASDSQSYYLPYDTVTELQDAPVDLQVSVSVTDPENVAGTKTAVEEALVDFPTVDVLDIDDILGQIRGLLTALVGMIAGLLMMSLLVAIVGIVLTLYLAVIERTRETGLLRAVGMTRRQVRMMIRRESVLISIFGTILGLSLGMFVGWVLAVTVVGEGVRFSIPWLWVIGALVASFVAGVLAAVVPARRAARLDVLTAIAYE